MTFHQPVYSPDGKALFDETDTWTPIKFWCDFWWDVAHLNVQGKTYLDVGSAEGLYPLRFAQRGGVGTGLNPNWVSVEGEIIGTRSKNVTSEQLKRMYPDESYSVLNGGFDLAGVLEPQCPLFDYVSCMNTLEYVQNPKACVDSLFDQAKEQVMIATDISFGPTKEYPNGSMGALLRHLSLEELRSWSPWPNIVRTMTYQDSPQGLLIARNDGNFSGITEEAPVFSLGDRMTTQVRWENSK